MSAFKGHPELKVAEGQVDGLFRLETGKGVVLASGVFRSREEAERFAECWNGLRKIAFPQAHLEATEEYVVRLERLRKEAVAAQGAPVLGWNFDMSVAPRDPKAKLLVAHPTDGKVYLTKWNPPTTHTPQGWWSGFAPGFELLAWMPWPEHPFQAKANDEACETGLDMGRAEAPADASDGVELASRVVGGRTSTATPERMDVTAGETAPLITHHQFILDDVGSGA
jgi:hypothetical protein